jgi:biotin synthase-like enzyme
MSHEEIFSDPQALLESLKLADKKTREVHGPEVILERALFLSWWCDVGSCSFCYMSTQKKRIKESGKARRRPSSILAESELLRRIGWKAAFVSGGYGAYDLSEIRALTKKVHDIIGEPVWLNVGVLSKSELTNFHEEVVGVVGSVEAVAKSVRQRVCPGKPLEPILSMFQDARDQGFKLGMTIILGIGESVDDVPLLLDFVKDNRIEKITIYSLNPHPSTPFSKSPPPASLYQAGVIASLRLKFPKLRITAGTWIDQLPNIGIVLLAGANGITKYPLFKMFGNRYGKKVEDEIAFSGRKLSGTFTDISMLNGGSGSKKLKDEKIQEAVDRYVQRIMVGL